MKLLILGGTEFVGRAAAVAAVARGWEVTVLHRGSKPSPEGTVHLLGDRRQSDGLAALDGAGEWDAVLDTWSEEPRVVRDSARALAGRAGRYVYVSSRSVYAYPTGAGLDESAPVVSGDPDAGPTDYAADKRGGELAAEREFGADRTVSARAGLILGPWENIGRLPWWLLRAARGGPVPAPGPRSLPLQYIDVRDLAEWLLGAVERGLSGPYNLVSEQGHTTMGELLDTVVEVTGGRADLRWVTPEQVAAAGVEGWTDLPVWLPPGDLHDTLHRGNVARALATGLHCRPIRATVTDTWAWLGETGYHQPSRPERSPVGLPEAKEQALLKL